ncbi:MAG: hypothetical protein EB145_18325 [Proteobacteria bacterium]|nr:hypothetical protein [Pseudomonadota bacterium]
MPSTTDQASLEVIDMIEATTSMRLVVGCTAASLVEPRGPRPVASCTMVTSSNTAPIATHVRHDIN